MNQSGTPLSEGRTTSPSTSRVVEFSLVEIAHIYDRVGGSDLSDGEEEFPAVTATELRTLMLKIASAYVAISHPQKEAHSVSLSLNETELWIIKDRVALTDMMGSSNIGAALSRKLCVALLAVCDLDES